MKIVFMLLMGFLALTSFSQQTANPVSVQTVKNCIDKFALKDFKALKGDSLYGSDRNNGHKNYWGRYKLIFQLGSDSSFVLYRSALQQHSLEFFYGLYSDGEESIQKVVKEVFAYYIKKYKWTQDKEVDDPEDEMILLDKKRRVRLQFTRDFSNRIVKLDIFSAAD